jgi:ElaB/YqjD/DUF883 family membrane-anchored ribosome-binding protein
VGTAPCRLNTEWIEKSKRKQLSKVNEKYEGFTPSIANALNRKMALIHDAFVNAYAEADRLLIRELDTAQQKVEQLRRDLDSTMQDIRKRFASSCKGIETLLCPAICEADKKAVDNFLKQANEVWEKYFENAFTLRVRHIKHIVYTQQYGLFTNSSRFRKSKFPGIYALNLCRVNWSFSNR